MQDLGGGDEQLETTEDLVSGKIPLKEGFGFVYILQSWDMSECYSYTLEVRASTSSVCGEVEPMKLAGGFLAVGLASLFGESFRVMILLRGAGPAMYARFWGQLTLFSKLR